MGRKHVIAARKMAPRSTTPGRPDAGTMTGPDLLSFPEDLLYLLPGATPRKRGKRPGYKVRKLEGRAARR